MGKRFVFQQSRASQRYSIFFASSHLSNNPSRQMAFKSVLPILVLVAVLLPLLGMTEASRELAEKQEVNDSKFFWFVPGYCLRPSPTSFVSCAECRTFCAQKTFIVWSFCYPRCCPCA